jgi:hypothetical protein
MSAFIATCSAGFSMPACAKGPSFTSVFRGDCKNLHDKRILAYGVCNQAVFIRGHMAAKYAYIALALAALTTAASVEAQSPAVYVLSGNIAGSTALGGATCAPTGTTLVGESYFPGFGHKNFAITIKPVKDLAIGYMFPALSSLNASGDVQYVLPPSTTPLKGTFQMTAGVTTATSFSFTLTTVTGSQGDPSQPGTCNMTYNMKLTKGLPAALKNLL